MKINGPGQPPGTPPSTGEGVGDKAKTGNVAGSEAPSSKTFADQLSGPGAASKAAGPQVAAAKQAQAPEQAREISAVPVSDVAAELRAGKLTPQAAIDKVMERVVARQLGPEAPPAVRDRVRVALQDAIESDPLLSDKLSRLG